jgi:hypothetical protein
MKPDARRRLAWRRHFVVKDASQSKTVGVRPRLQRREIKIPREKPKPKPEETDDRSGRGDAGERSGKGGIARRHTPGARGAALQIGAAGAKEGATKGRYR